MNSDIFDMLDKAGFGSNVHEVAAEGECRVLRLDDKTGEGFMTMYRVMDGVYLMYNDFHLSSCTSEYQNAETVLCIDHCREGRIEHENDLGSRYYMEAGDLRIDRRVHHEGSIHLPLSHYHGITIGFVQGAAERSLKSCYPSLDIDIKAIGERFCPDKREFLLRANEPLNMLFSQLYSTPKSIRIDYYRVKISELLLLLTTIDPTACSTERQYFPASQTEKIKNIQSLMTSELHENFTVEELSKRFDLPPATLRNVFKAVYGSPIYRYIKSYKMKAAAAMLISDRSLTIGEISQRLGYDNASKFSAAFKDVMGVTPHAYRSAQEEQ